MVNEADVLSLLRSDETNYQTEENLSSAFPYKRLILKVFSDLEITSEEYEKTIKRTWGE
ncbi:MAG: hypothetical protein KKD46_03430 [Euryarchaeota archaeon]|nr:hypothetical protein [Euryarchaeota archaeon]MBU4339952.1 hypothetical protein [Euryarchaeota archaeon]MBU4453694.1 hypothetical protein [Euryarchaeota archaeon]MCG2737752.1 hypothetical protein [Candidatus Methanoperedenaceae archaeon]